MPRCPRGSEDAPGTAIDSRAARWARFGSKVGLLTVNYDNWAGESAALRRAIEAVALPSVIAVFDVVKEGAGGAPIIDITSLFTTNAPQGAALHLLAPRDQYPRAVAGIHALV